jgi:Zn-dependent peptidase ImmA (M78 family)
MTNNTIDNTSMSDLKTLRSLMPSRSLTFGEALQIAEHQANRLLSLHQLTAPAVPIEIITEQPRIRVVQSYDLPASGSAHWDGQDWVITLNASEYDLRQRYTLCHEYKHLLDHPVRTRQLHVQRSSSMTPEEAAEKVADYFAACLLMPKAWVKSGFFGLTQNVERLAARFQVSVKAMSYRLNELGLASWPDHCRPSSQARWTNTHPGRPRSPRQPYQRAFPLTPQPVTAGVSP